MALDTKDKVVLLFLVLYAELSALFSLSLFICVCVCVCVCVRAPVRACVDECARACVDECARSNACLSGIVSRIW